MEKLKAEHDHKLTDILKVAIFGLMLILPGLILLPSMLYYGVNEHATAPTEQVEKIEYERVNFNQLVKNGNFTNTDYWTPQFSATFNVSNNIASIESSTRFSQISQDIDLLKDHVYYFKFNYDTTANNSWCYFFYNYTANVIDDGKHYLSSSNNEINYILNSSYSGNTQVAFQYDNVDDSTLLLTGDVQLFDLTQMFGSGNEPTAQQFNEWYTENYYEYTESRYEILEKPTGTYETYTDITSQIQYNWNSLWQQPLFSWTNYTILKQGLDNFTYVFGITQTSYINNLIVYELIMVAIYIVIDIVLTLFKWLTHLIGEK